MRLTAFEVASLAILGWSVREQVLETSKMSGASIHFL